MNIVSILRSIGILLNTKSGELTLATNTPYGDGQRKGAVESRSQTQTGSGHWVKRDANTGRFMDVKSDGKPFKSVRKEK